MTVILNVRFCAAFLFLLLWWQPEDGPIRFRVKVARSPTCPQSERRPQEEQVPEERLSEGLSTHTPHWYSLGFVFIWFEILIFKISKFMGTDGFLFVELTALNGCISKSLTAKCIWKIKAVFREECGFSTVTGTLCLECCLKCFKKNSFEHHKLYSLLHWSHSISFLGWCLWTWANKATTFLCMILKVTWKFSKCASGYCKGPWESPSFSQERDER